MPVATDNLCVDCQTNVSEHTIRRRNLCTPCFQHYIAGKVLKRMNTGRQSTSPRQKFFLPISNNSSVALLHVLSAQISRQLTQQGRSTYDILLCHVTPPVFSRQTVNDEVDRWWTDLKQCFPSFEFLPLLRFEDILVHDSSIHTALSHLGLPAQQCNESNQDYIDSMFTSLRTPTARSDLEQILLDRLLLSIAARNECTGILYSESSSDLAAITLSLVAKGRGSVVAELLADTSVISQSVLKPAPSTTDDSGAARSTTGDILTSATQDADTHQPVTKGSLYGESDTAISLTLLRPLRDLYNDEIQIYISTHTDLLALTNSSPSRSVKLDSPPSLRQSSIDSVMQRYVSEQGVKYPGVMANVVRTAGKLHQKEGGRRCGLCKMSCDGNDVLCYGCNRMKGDIRLA